MLALQCQQPFLVDGRAALDHAAAQGVGDARGDVDVVFGGEVAGLQVGQLRFEGGGTDVAGDGDMGVQGRAVAGFGQRQRDLLGDVQQFVGVEHDHVAVAQQAQVLRFEGAGGNLGHRHGLEHLLQLLERVGRIGFGRAHGQFMQATTGGQQADAGLDQTDVAFQCSDGAGRMHLEFAAAAESHAAHG